MTMFLQAAAAALLLATAALAQPLITSDRRDTGGLPYPPGMTNVPQWPGRQRIYAAPEIDVFPLLLTNIRPIVVEVTVITQVVQRTVWYHGGIRATNDSLLSSNVLSRTTNDLSTP